MNITLRLAWRNLWRQPRRTWLTVGAMTFSNVILVFMISLQFGMYGMMIDNTLSLFSGHAQIQADGYLDDRKMRQVVERPAELAAFARSVAGDAVAVRANAFALASSAERSFGVQVVGVEPVHEPAVSTLPGLLTAGRYLDGGPDGMAAEAVIGSVLARNLKVVTGGELTLIGSGRDGSFAAAVVTIAGIFDSGIPELDRGVIEILLPLFQDVFFMRGAAHEVVVRLPELDAVPAVVAAPRATLIEGSQLPADAEILAIKAEQHYIRIWSDRGRDLVRDRFKDVPDALAGTNGEQVHRSWWVNLGRVANLQKAGRSIELQLDGDLRVPASLAHRNTVLRELGEEQH